ncbi:MAG: DUF1049 domain-containing protein [Rhodospirillales bacterium]|nr:DUF1049 domain-containing protein [Rhodospirillales bacterium]
MKLLFWIIALPLALIVIVFALNNRMLIDIDTWPLEYTLKVPLFGIALVGIFIGFLWGGIIAWIGAGKTRKRARDLHRRVETDQREKAALEHKIKKMEAAEQQAAIPPAPADAA